MPKVLRLASGVYCIHNKIDGKRYIGSAKNFKKRWDKHVSGLNKGEHPKSGKRHSNLHLIRAWKLYGAESFEFLILECCLPRDCIEREQYWIDFHQATDLRYGYNINPTAGNCLGRRHSDETRIRLSIVNKGKKLSDEHKAKLRGKKHTDEARAKISAAGKGRKVSEETKAKVAAVWVGRKHSEETKAKMSASQKRRVSDPKEMNKMVKLAADMRATRKEKRMRKLAVTTPHMRLLFD